MNYLIISLILLLGEIHLNRGFENDKVSILSSNTNYTNTNKSLALYVLNLNTTDSSLMLNASSNSSGNKNESINNAHKNIAENVDKDLIIDNIYTTNESQNVELKCPIELNKQPNKEETPKQTFSDPAKIIEPLSEFYDYTDEENVENHSNKNKRNADDSNLFIVQWYKDALRIKDQTRVEQDGIYLRIGNVTSKDAGKYKCKLINGFGSVSTIITLNVLPSHQQSLLTTSTKSPERADSKKTKNVELIRTPVFTSPERMQPRYFNKRKGSQIRFKCRASGVPRPDILWFKNGEILNEEDYGITRSKWTIDLKDLRLSDSGNYTCQVFNKYGFINATYELNIYEDSKHLFEGMDPLNTTVLAGMNAEFTCRIKSLTKPNIKWMKQISKSEYANYIVQNNLNGENSNIGEIISEIKQAHKETQDFSKSEEDEMLKSFYSASTLSPLSVIENRNIPRSDTNFDETLFLSDLINQNLNEKSYKNDFNFELYVPNEKHLSKIGQKEKNVQNTLPSNIDDSVHYITLSSSPLITQQVSYDNENNYYISKLTLKQVQVQDSGIYVCFGDNADAYNSRKSYLKVLPQKNRASFEEKSRKGDINQLNLLLQQQQRAKNYFVEYQNKNNFLIKNEPKEAATSLTDSLNSNSLLIVLIPILLIISFAIASIFYLKQMDDRKIKNSNSEFGHNISSRRCNFFNKNIFKCLKGENKKSQQPYSLTNSNRSNVKKSSTNSYCCCPSTEINPHTLIQTMDESDTLSEKPRNFKKSRKLTTSNSCVNNNSLPCATNSLGSSLSDSSSSTTATTVAYYAAIPLLIENNNSSPPPPLPNSPPPTFSPSFSVNSKLNTSSPNYNFQASNLERVISTPSMAYYKIVDCDLMDCKDFKKTEDHQHNKKLDFDLNNTSNSQFYYQLSPNDPK